MRRNARIGWTRRSLASAVAGCLAAALTVPADDIKDPACRKPAIYRAPYAISGGKLVQDVPEGQDFWIPRAIVMRFQSGDFMLWDPDTCRLRGWWPAGRERRSPRKWGTILYLAPESAFILPLPEPRPPFVPPDGATGKPDESLAEIPNFAGPLFRAYQTNNSGSYVIEWKSDRRNPKSSDVTEFFTAAGPNDIPHPGVHRDIFWNAPGPFDVRLGSFPEGLTIDTQEGEQEFPAEANVLVKPLWRLMGDTPDGPVVMYTPLQTGVAALKSRRAPEKPGYVLIDITLGLPQSTPEPEKKGGEAWISYVRKMK